MADETIHLRLQQRRDHQFETQFDGHVPPLLSDEPPPLGQASGPSPVQLLSSAVGNCLCNSLLFALRKFKQAPEPMSCELETSVGRNAEGRMRVLAIAARLQLGVPAASLAHLDRVLEQFESYCTVTQSVRSAIPVAVSVFDADGVRLK
ncbi:MAG TPA: OsmC family protein [Roseateles sp.]|nr:OsmC family protein [Roseateles sp.]